VHLRAKSDKEYKKFFDQKVQSFIMADFIIKLATRDQVLLK
jgi:hypothetical protein